MGSKGCLCVPVIVVLVCRGSLICCVSLWIKVREQLMADMAVSIWCVHRGELDI